MRAVARHRLRHHLIGKAGGLHGAQGLVVDRDRARLMNGGGIALDQHASNAVDAEQIGKRQPGRARADNGDGMVSCDCGRAACMGGLPLPSGERVGVRGLAKAF